MPGRGLHQNANLSVWLCENVCCLSKAFLMDVSDQPPTFIENFSAGSITHAIALICVVRFFPRIAFCTVDVTNSVFIVIYPGVQQ